MKQFVVTKVRLQRGGFLGVLLALASILHFVEIARAGGLSVSFASVPQGSVVDLTAEGKVDWVHWGLYTESSLSRKSGVPPQISDYRIIDAPLGFAYPYQYADNYNGYSWRDGYPSIAATNTTTGVWAYGTPLVGAGFEITAPADTSMRILKVYVGAFAAQADFEVNLSDGSAPGYSNGTLVNIRNGPGRVYTIEYSADSPGQQLIVRWTLGSPREATGNVTLQAAALSTPGANNPPVVTLTAPTNNASFASGATVQLGADSYDADGSIALVEFWSGGLKIAEDPGSPYTAEWVGAPTGHHVIIAKAFDVSGAARSSVPVDIFVHGSGGTLSGTINTPPGSVDLTAEGTADWRHFGRLEWPEFDRKAVALPQIGNVVPLGSSPVSYSSQNSPYYSWSDGTPLASHAGTPSGIYINGFTNGFEFTVPAATVTRQVKVYISMYGVQANFQAFLSDASAAPYIDTSFDSVFGSRRSVLTLNYAAATAGQHLLVRCRSSKIYDMDYGNVAIESIALPAPRSPLALLNPSWSAGIFGFSFPSEAGRIYHIEYSEGLVPEFWQELTTISGNGEVMFVFDENATGDQRFYRLWVQ